MKKSNKLISLLGMALALEGFKGSLDDITPDLIRNDYSSSVGYNFKKSKHQKNIRSRIVGRSKHREGPKIGRNEPCTCGSGNKYKYCCLNK